MAGATRAKDSSAGSFSRAKGQIYVDKYVNNAQYLGARSGPAPEMGTVSGFRRENTKSKEIVERRKTNMATKKKAAKKKKH
jgi:hypothetical protein